VTTEKLKIKYMTQK